MPHDFKTGGSKGFAFAEFEEMPSAQKVIEELDGTTFQGRLMHVLPSAAKREPKLDEFSIAQLPLKKRKIMEKRQNASSSTFNWNSMFMNVSVWVLGVRGSANRVSPTQFYRPQLHD